MTDEKRDKLFDAIGEYFDECGTGTIIDINNRWNDDTSDGNYIYDMGDFDDHYSCMCPSDIADAVTNGEYDSCDDYFVDDGYCHTFCDPTDWIDFSALTSYIVDNDDDLGDSHIRALLDDANKEEDEIAILIHPTEGEDFVLTYGEFMEKHDNTSDLYLSEDGKEIMTGHEVILWLDEHEQDELVLHEFSVRKFLEDNGFTERRAVCRYDGFIFGDGTCYEDGRFFRWFYCPHNGLLLKLYYSTPFSEEIIYIKEMPVESSDAYNMYLLIKNYINN